MNLFDLLPAAADTVEPPAGTGVLVVAALVGIAAIVVLITVVRLHPFLSLTIGSFVTGAVATQAPADTIESFATGVGDTVAGVGMLIALGAMFGKLLADSGGADQIVDTIVGRASTRTLPWAMAGIGALIGLPMFFEIGLVLLMPVIFLVSRRSGLPLLSVGIPALAGLSAMHGFVPPHPGPLVAIDSLGADLGITLGLGVLVAVPVIVVSGPLFARFPARWVDVPAPELFEGDREGRERRPAFGVTVATVLLPVVLMMGKALADIFASEDAIVRQALDFVGEPLVALLLATLVAMLTLGRGAGMTNAQIGETVSSSLGPIAGILLIVAAGGGFKQTLVGTGIADVIGDAIEDSGVSLLLLAWLVAVVIRLATGSATVATITAAGIMAESAGGMGTAELSLLVLAIGAGSVFFSHVNDAGFWLVKEYFGLSVGQTIKSWSLMETVLSVSGLVVVLVLGIFV